MNERYCTGKRSAHCAGSLPAVGARAACCNTASNRATATTITKVAAASTRAICSRFTDFFLQPGPSGHGKQFRMNTRSRHSQATQAVLDEVRHRLRTTQKELMVEIIRHQVVAQHHRRQPAAFALPPFRWLLEHRYWQ